MNPPQPEFTYERMGTFTYHVVRDSAAATDLLRYWLQREWEQDRAEAPGEPWTAEWLSLLPRLEFRLAEVDLASVHVRADLMAHHTGAHRFVTELRARAREREESVLRGVSIEPLVVLERTGELMDGYTRYWVLREHREPRAFAYLGSVRT
jgi:hypothetical protein